jgi:hypothetical protein
MPRNDDTEGVLFWFVELLHNLKEKGVRFLGNCVRSLFKMIVNTPTFEILHPELREDHSSEWGNKEYIAYRLDSSRSIIYPFLSCWHFLPFTGLLYFLFCTTSLYFYFYPQSLIAVAMVISGTIDSLIDFFSFTAWIFYGGSMLALIVMRYTKPNAPRPYKVMYVVLTSYMLRPRYLV